MPGPDFLDTNILVYAYDRSDLEKRQIAQGLVRRAVTKGAETVISPQVLGEFASTLLHKVSTTAPQLSSKIDTSTNPTLPPPVRNTISIVFSCLTAMLG
jgi:predicted nucleic acid-binding protein